MSRFASTFDCRSIDVFRLRDRFLLSSRYGANVDIRDQGERKPIELCRNTNEELLHAFTMSVTVEAPDSLREKVKEAAIVADHQLAGDLSQLALSTAGQVVVRPASSHDEARAALIDVLQRRATPPKDPALVGSVLDSSGAPGARGSVEGVLVAFDSAASSPANSRNSSAIAAAPNITTIAHGSGFLRAARRLWRQRIAHCCRRGSQDAVPHFAPNLCRRRRSM